MAITKVTNSLVATNAIQGTLIADNAITSVHIAQNQVTAVQIPDGSITSTQIAANSIDTAELVTGSIDTIHIGDSQVTTAKIADLNVTTGKIANNAITAAKIPDGSITATQLDSSTAPTFGNITTTGSLRGPASFTIDPAAVGDNTGTVVIAGSLQVDGTTTTVNSTTLSVADKNIVIASGAADAAAANDAGLTVTGASATLLYKSSGDKWSFNKPLDITGNSTATNQIATTSVYSNNGVYYGASTLDLKDSSSASFLSFASNKNATFAGAISSGAITSTGNMTIAFDSNNSGNRLRIADTEGNSAAVRTYSTADGTGLILNHYYAVAGSPYVRYSDFVSSMGDGAATNMRFLTKPLNGNPTVALTIDQSQNATFEGTISSGAITSTGSSTFTSTGIMDINLVANPPELNFEDTSSTSGTKRARWTLDDNNFSAHGLADNDGSVTQSLLSFALSSGAATFGGTINSGAITSSGTLTINTDANSTFTIADGGADAITLYGGSGDELYIGANAAYKLRFKTDGNIVMDNGGSFGIGTPSPYHTFDVFGAVIANGAAKSNGLFFDTTSATTGTGGGIALGGYSNGTGGAIYHFGNIQGIKENSTAGNYASAMVFSTRANGATPTERMRIDSAGTMILRADGAANLGRIQFSSQASTYQILGGNNVGYLGYKTGGYHRWFGSDGAEDMRIDSSGNVGIGTGTNISSPLTVQTNGSASALSIIGRNNGTSDEAVISFYEYDGTTRNAYIIKEAGNLAFATGTGGSATESMRIRSGGNVTKPTQCNFLARRSGDQTGYNASGAYGDGIRYNSEIYDIGGDFDVTTGIFTAPVDGTYLIQGSVYSNTSGVTWSQAWLAVNGSRELYTDMMGNDGDNFISTTHIVKLSAGDEVRYHPYYGSSSSVNIVANNNHTWFKGYLLG